MFLKKLASQRVGFALVGTTCLAVTVAFAIAGNTQQAKSDSTPAKASASKDGFQPTEFAHVEVRSIPKKNTSKMARQISKQGSNAWIYVEPGTKYQPQARAGTRATKPIRTEALPGGGVIVHLDRNLMYSSKAHVTKNGKAQLDCDKADGTAHRH